MLKRLLIYCIVLGCLLDSLWPIRCILRRVCVQSLKPDESPVSFRSEVNQVRHVSQMHHGPISRITFEGSLTRVTKEHFSRVKAKEFWRVQENVEGPANDDLIAVTGKCVIVVRMFGDVASFILSFIHWEVSLADKELLDYPNSNSSSRTWDGLLYHESPQINMAWRVNTAPPLTF